MIIEKLNCRTAEYRIVNVEGPTQRHPDAEWRLLRFEIGHPLFDMLFSRD